MFRALLFPSSGAQFCNVDFNIGRFVLGLQYVGGCSLQPGHYSSLPAPNLQHTENQERNDQCDNQHYSSQLLRMGIVMPETCWDYNKWNLVGFLFFSYHKDARSNTYLLILHNLGETNLLLLSPAPHFRVFKSFLIYFTPIKFLVFIPQHY